MQSEHNEITFTREELYERLWQAPASHLAKELGISDVMLGKICGDFQIPKPYPGYWAKKADGKNPTQTPLPALDELNCRTLIFRHRPEQQVAAPLPPSLSEYDDEITALLAEAVAMPPIQVPEVLGKPHPLVQLTKRGLAEDIVANLQAALASFQEIANGLESE